jgi:membrane protein implicated in regulation of membrane protease activity
MQQIPYRSSPSLLTRVLGGLITITALVVGLTVGFALFLAVLGLAAIALAVFYARFYWVRRRMMQRMQQHQQRRRGEAQEQAHHHVIEGEYRVEQPRERR